MKNIKYYLILAVFSLGIEACHIDDCLDGSDSIIVESFDLRNIKGVTLDMNAQVHLVQGDKQSIVVEGPENVINDLSTLIQDDIWIIDTDRHFFLSNRQMDIFITLPQIEAIRVNSSGDVLMERYFDDLDNVLLMLTGSGNKEFNGFAQTIITRNSGSGEITLFGDALFNDVRNSGSGTIRGWNLGTNDIGINSSGSGDSYIFPINNLTGTITGSGNVYYIGDPNIDVIATGSGDLINSN